MDTTYWEKIIDIRIAFPYIFPQKAINYQRGGEMLRKLIGINNYMHSIGYLSDLYHSVFLKIKEDGINLIPHLVPVGGTVFDIGANIGRFTSFAATLVGKHGTVYSFEPLAYPRKVLRHMIFLRRLRQVKVMDTALSDRSGEAVMTIPLKNGWKPKPALAYLGGAATSSVLTVTVLTETIDSFLSNPFGQ